MIFMRRRRKLSTTAPRERPGSVEGRLNRAYRGSVVPSMIVEGAGLWQDPPMARPSAPSALVVSGLAEVALGALAGWPYTFVRQDPEAARRLLGIKSAARVRQWHLDL